MFGNKLFEGLAHSQEFMDIIRLVPLLKNFAYQLTPLVGVLDFFIAFALLFNPPITKSRKIQTGLFVWTMLWPFIPSSLRYFGGVAEFEIVEVMSISIAALVAYLLWRTFSKASTV
jgi:hypothetical protein